MGMRALICLAIVAIHVAFVTLVYFMVVNAANHIDEALGWGLEPMRGWWMWHALAVVLAPLAVTGIAYLRHIDRRWFESVALTLAIEGTALSFAPLGIGLLTLNVFAIFVVLGTVTGLTLVLCCFLIWATAVFLLE